MLRSPRLPLEIIDRSLEELANDPHRPAKAKELDLSNCAKASDMLRTSARRARYRQRELALGPSDIAEKVKMWTYYAPVVTPYLSDLKVTWYCPSTTDRSDVIALIGRLSKAVLQRLKVVGVDRDFPILMHQLAGQTTIYDLSLRFFTSIPAEILTYRKALRKLEIKDSQVLWTDPMPFSSDFNFVFDMEEDFDANCIRHPSSFTLGLYSTLEYENTLLQTYSGNLTSLTLVFHDQALEHLDDLSGDLFVNLKHLELEFMNEGSIQPEIDIARWVEKRGGSNIEDFTVCFSHSCEIYGDILAIMICITDEGSPHSITNLFDANVFPKLANGQVILKFYLICYDSYQDWEVISMQEMVTAEAQGLFGGKTSVPTVAIKGLIVSAEDPITLRYCQSCEEGSGLEDEESGSEDEESGSEDEE